MDIELIIVGIAILLFFKWLFAPQMNSRRYRRDNHYHYNDIDDGNDRSDSGSGSGGHGGGDSDGGD